MFLICSSLALKSSPFQAPTYAFLFFIAIIFLNVSSYSQFFVCVRYASYFMLYHLKNESLSYESNVSLLLHLKKKRQKPAKIFSHETRYRKHLPTLDCFQISGVSLSLSRSLWMLCVPELTNLPIC